MVICSWYPNVFIIYLDFYFLCTILASKNCIEWYFLINISWVLLKIPTLSILMPRASLRWEIYENIHNKSRIYRDIQSFSGSEWSPTHDPICPLFQHSYLIQKNTEFLEKSSKTIDNLRVFFEPKWSPTHIPMCLPFQHS